MKIYIIKHPKCKNLSNIKDNQEKKLIDEKEIENR